MSWTQPVCENKFHELYPDREPHRLMVPESQWELCCYCFTPTNIYVRLDPKTVPFPRNTDE